MTRIQRFLTTLSLMLGVTAVAASPALADNSMPVPAPDDTAAVTAPAVPAVPAP